VLQRLSDRSDVVQRLPRIEVKLEVDDCVCVLKQEYSFTPSAEAIEVGSAEQVKHSCRWTQQKTLTSCS
jgi:hypothetical protein